jgi:methyl-accepting chemotaxis protein
MGIYRDASIRTKLVSAFSAMVLLVALLGGFAIHSFNTFNGIAREMVDNYQASLLSLGTIQKDLSDYRQVLLASITYRDDPKQIAILDQALISFKAKHDADAQQYAAAVVSSPEERAMYDAYARVAAVYFDSASSTHTLLRSGHLAEALA